MSIDNEKIKLKIKALLAQAESESKEQIDSSTGEKAGYANIAASLAFAKKAQELAKKYHLDLNALANKQESTIEYVPPVVDQSVILNPFYRSNARRRERMFWFEELAKVVAKGYFCKAGVNSSNEVFIVGLDFDREVCEMVFLNLAEAANKLEPIELKKAKKAVGLPSMNKDALILDVWCGDEIFTDSFHAGFREQVAEIYKDNEQETSSIAVEEYYNNINFWDLASDYSASLSSSYSLSSVPPINETVKEIGKRAGRVLSKKVGATKEEALNKQNQLIKSQQVNRANLEGTEIIIILDASGSMYEELMNEAKTGAINYAKEVINDKTSVGLVIFDHRIRKNLSPTKNIEQFQSSINGIRGEGSTDMVLAFNQARMKLKNKNVRQVVMLITDGIPDSVSKTIALANNMKRQGIEIMAIGTSGCNQEFLDKITNKKGMGLLVSNSDFGSGIKSMAGLLGA